MPKQLGGKISGKPHCGQRPSGTPQYHRWSSQSFCVSQFKFMVAVWSFDDVKMQGECH
jgi:hypothetical protein